MFTYPTVRSLMCQVVGRGGRGGADAKGGSKLFTEVAEEQRTFQTILERKWDLSFCPLLDKKRMRRESDVKMEWTHKY